MKVLILIVAYSDAHIVLRLDQEGSSPSDQSLVYLCVADGVGSWRQHGVDPRQFSHNIVKNAERVILADAQQRSLMRDSGWIGGGLSVVGGWFGPLQYIHYTH